MKDRLKAFFTKTLPSFFKTNFEISSTKKSFIAGVITTCVLVFLVILDNRKFITLESRSKWLLLAFCLAFPIAIGALIAFKIKVKKPKTAKTGYVLLFIIMPLLTMAMTESLNSVFIYDMTYLGFIANYITISLFYFLVFAISGSLRVSVLTLTPVFYGFALAHSYLMDFRGTPFVPMDFLSVTTAANVGSTYDYTPTAIIVAGSLLFIFIMVLGAKIHTPSYTLSSKLVSRISMGIFFSAVMGIFYFTSIFTDAGIKPYFWNQTKGYKNYGFVYNFVCNTKYIYMSTPSGYDPSVIGDYISKETENDDKTPKPTGNEPNIICIMNESLSDLSVLGDFSTNEDYMPFMRSLTENTVKGNLYVPVIGAGTSNTEFEFLTGHSTAFLPSGSNAYMLYIKNPLASIVSTLKGQGYSALAFHPYYASGWNRTSVYRNMGFDSFKSLENIMDISLMDIYKENSSDPDYLQDLIEQQYPDRSDMLIRQYVSDSYDYKILIQDFENRDKSVPYFVFNVTMQNHSSYTNSARTFNECINITSSDKNYVKANKYLSLVKASDTAFQELVNYFRNVKEPTIICMFGDHQPSVESGFIAEALGVSNLLNLTLEQEQKRHITPFIIWANYDIEEKYIEKLSSNYLSSYLLDIAGVKLTSYNKYLLKLSEKLPVIDTVGYIDADNNYYKWSNNTQYTNLLKEYEKIQYNNIFDYEHKDNNIFYIEGYSAEDIAADKKKAEEAEKVQAKKEKAEEKKNQIKKAG